MATEYDDPRDERDDRGDREDSVTRGKRKLATPGLFLLLAGLLSLILEIGSIGLMVGKPTIVYDFFVAQIEKTPPGPDRQKQLDDMKKQEAEMRLDSPLNMASAGIGAILAILTVAGGFSMRSGSSYGLALTGAICAIIPISGCCCVGMPVGIWAIVVLVDASAKKGFARSNPRDEFDSNRGED